MNRSDLVVGRVYVVAGCGEMLLVPHEPAPMAGFRAYGGLGREPALHFMGHSGGSYWVGSKQVMCEATREDIERRYANAKPRGVACEDLDCWCRRVL